MNEMRGFSLIELMVVVAIVAILAGVAVPSYRHFVEDGQHAEAIALVMDVASRQERYYTQNGSYATAVDASGLNVPDGDSGASGIQSENGYYTVTTTGGGTFTITAAPTFSSDTECASFTLTNTGVRGVTGSLQAKPQECWR